MCFPVSTLQFIAQMVRKVTHFKYDFHDSFTVIIINSSIVNKWRENEQILFYSFVFAVYSRIFNSVLITFSDQFLAIYLLKGVTDGQRNSAFFIV